LFHGKLRADQVHNIYGHQWAKLLADGYKKDYPNERPFTLMRSGYSGTQRYGIIPWSGDVNRTWGGLKPQMEISMQMGLQGVSYMHSDLGGFAGANDDPELYLRWLQYGVFQPVFRPHAQEEVASEPIFKDAKTKELAKQAIELRYQLLPYNYTLAFINHTKGTPLMRPVFMEDSLSDWSYTSIKHYFWGDAFFVSPITSKRDSTELGIEHVTLPNGTWFDFHTGNVEERNIGLPGKEMKGTLVKKDLTKIPVFVKSGSFVPMSEKIQSTDEFNPNQVSVHFYYDSKLKKSSGIWYDDDGLTNEAFEKQKYEMINFKFQKNTKKSIITIKKTVGKAYQSKIDSFNLIIHFDNKIPKSIKIGKQVFSSAQFLKNNYLKIPISLNSTDIKITFVD
jgi:alpha-glucosidase (family GH31 glycosyl hydrolase)